MVILCLTFSLLSHFLIFFSKSRSPLNTVALWFLSFNLLGMIAFFVIDGFSKQGLNDAAIAHLKFAFDPASLIRFWPTTLLSVIVLCVVIFATLKFQIYLTNRASKRSNSVQLVALSCGLLGAIGFNPLTSESLLLYQANQLLKTVELPEKYSSIENVAPITTVRSPTNKPSFAIIMAESLESAFLDHQIYPNLTPKLNRLIKSKGFRIDGIKDLQLSNWTDTALVAIFCGTSMSVDRANAQLSQNKNKADEYTSVVGETCIGDILNNDGYKLEFFGSSDFGAKNKRNLLEPQGINVALGPQEILNGKNSAKNLSTWGLYDSDLFSRTLGNYSLTSDKEPPTGYIFLTVDTHTPGYFSKDCINSSSPPYANDLLIAVHCADANISSTVNSLLENNEDLVVFLLSDHILPGPLPEADVPKENRENLFVVFNSQLNKAIPGNRIYKLSTSLDIGPTILANLGYDIESINFGRNLLSDKPTLPESMGIATFKKNIVKLRRLMRAHWKSNYETVGKELQE